MLTSEQKTSTMSYDEMAAEADRLIYGGWLKNFDRLTELYHLMKGYRLAIALGQEDFTLCDKCHIPICCAIEGHCDRQGNGYR